jgi:hypothetical protein
MAGLQTWEVMQLRAQDSANDLRYAQRLATELWEKYYKGDSPDWKPAHSISGVIDQIDNMTTGLARCTCVTEHFCLWLRGYLAGRGRDELTADEANRIRNTSLPSNAH